MAYLIGMAPPEPCPVCRLSPVGLEALEIMRGVARCARCGLAYEIEDLEGHRLPVARVIPSPGFVEIFRIYYQTTGRRIGVPAFIFGQGPGLEPLTLPPELRAEAEALDDWLRERPHLVAGATAPRTWPYAGLTVMAIEVDGSPAWQVIVPPSGLVTEPMVPFSPHAIPIGTIVSILIPLRQGDVRDVAEPEEEGHA